MNTLTIIPFFFKSISCNRGAPGSASADNPHYMDVAEFARYAYPSNGDFTHAGNGTGKRERARHIYLIYLCLLRVYLVEIWMIGF